MKKVFATSTVLLVALLVQALPTGLGQSSPWKKTGSTLHWTNGTMSHVLSPNGKRAAWTVEKQSQINQKIVLYDIKTSKERWITPTLTSSYGWQDVQSLAFSDDSTELAAAIQMPDRLAGRVDVYSTSTGKLLRRISYKKKDDILHTSEIKAFKGSRLEVKDHLEGTYVLIDGQVKKFVPFPRSDLDDPRIIRAAKGTVDVWGSPEHEEEIFSSSILNIGSSIRVTTGNTIEDLEILPDNKTVISCEMVGPKRGKNFTVVEGTGAVYCRDLIKDGRILYKVADLKGYVADAQLSSNGKIMLIIDRNFGEVWVSFYQR